MLQSVVDGYAAAKHGRFAEMSAVVTQHTAQAVAHVEEGSRYTYLHQAAWHGNLEAVQLLLSHGADPMVENSRNETPAETATRKGHPACAQVLAVAFGYAAAKHGRFAEMSAVVTQHTAQAVAHVEEGSRYTYLHQAAWHGNLEAVQLLLSHGADPMVENSRNETPAETATRKGHPACAVVISAVVQATGGTRTAASNAVYIGDRNLAGNIASVHLSGAGGGSNGSPASADGLDGADGSVASGGSSEPPILVISDPHGNLSLVREALERGVHEAGRMDLTVVLIGDYCDNGPEIPALLDFLCDVHDNGGRLGEMTLSPILGNHDLACLLALDPGAFGSQSPSDWWNRWHGFWNSWEVGTPGAYGCPPHCSVDTFRAAFPARHKQLLMEMPWHLELDRYIFVHAGMHADVTTHPMAQQLAFLANKDLSCLPASGFETYKGGGYGMPDHLTSKDWATTSTPGWGRTIVTGHNKNASRADLVTPYRIGLHSCACKRTEGGNPASHPLHCALLRRGVTDTTSADAVIAQFRVGD